MRVVGLDLSTRTGWAWFEDADGKPVCGTERLPKVFDAEDYGTRTLALLRWLDQFVEDHQPVNVIAFESPFIPMGPQKDKDTHGAEQKPTFVTTAQTLRLQISLASTIETVAKSHGIRCMEVATSSAKLMLTGHGRAPSGVKNWDWGREMVNAATRRGFPVADDHQADACAVALVAMASLRARAAA